jgi:coenzyme F420-reducing hydrogenase gamma subunit
MCHQGELHGNRKFCANCLKLHHREQNNQYYREATDGKRKSSRDYKPRLPQAKFIPHDCTGPSTTMEDTLSIIAACPHLTLEWNQPRMPTRKPIPQET